MEYFRQHCYKKVEYFQCFCYHFGYRDLDIYLSFSRPSKIFTECPENAIVKPNKAHLSAL